MSYGNVFRLLTQALLEGQKLDLVSGDVLYVLPAVNDAGAIAIGNGTYSFDVTLYGAIPTAFMKWDAAASLLNFRGPVRLRGANDVSPRLELRWIAGARGLPQLNAVTDPPAGDTYNTAAMAALLNADREFEILGTNASSDDVTANPEGGIILETDGASGDQVILLPHLNTGQSAWTTYTWGTDQQTEWSCHIKTYSNIADIILWAGLKLTNTSTTATDNDQVFFRFAPATNSGKWQAIYSIGGTDTAGDSGVTVAASTEYHLKVTIDSSRIARFYINGTLVATSTALTDATDLIPYLGVQASAAAAKRLYVFGQSISRAVA